MPRAVPTMLTSQHPTQISAFEIDDERGDLDACIVDHDNRLGPDAWRWWLDSLFPLRVIGDVQLHEASLGALFLQDGLRFPCRDRREYRRSSQTRRLRQRLCDRSADPFARAG